MLLATFEKVATGETPATTTARLADESGPTRTPLLLTLIFVASLGLLLVPRVRSSTRDRG